MNDKELLERAAKAAGIVIGVDARFIGSHDGVYFFNERREHPMCPRPNEAGNVLWNPLESDGDAFRLAVKLKINIVYQGQSRYGVSRRHLYDICCQFESADHASDIRHAIVRAAAALADGVTGEPIGGLPEDNYYKTQAAAALVEGE